MSLNVALDFARTDAWPNNERAGIRLIDRLNAIKLEVFTGSKSTI